MSNVAIGIPTYQRPGGLERLLQSLDQLQTEHQVAVIIADNDAARAEGLDLAQKLAAMGYRWPMQFLKVEERGISQVRNSLVEAFLERPDLDFLAMLDDDQSADPDWLDEILEVLQSTRADIAGGRLERRIDGPAPAWAARVPYLSSKSRGNSGSVDLVDSTGNIIFGRSVLSAAQRPVFEPAFGLSGGEDKEALTRLKHQGARFAWADRANVVEHVPTLRATERWVLQRSYRIGNSDMRVLLHQSGSLPEVCVETVKSLAMLAAAPFGWLMTVLRPATRITFRMKIWRAWGKLAGLSGSVYQEYALHQAE